MLQLDIVYNAKDIILYTRRQKSCLFASGIGTVSCFFTILPRSVYTYLYVWVFHIFTWNWEFIVRTSIDNFTDNRSDGWRNALTQTCKSNIFAWNSRSGILISIKLNDEYTLPCLIISATHDKYQSKHNARCFVVAHFFPCPSRLCL